MSNLTPAEMAKTIGGGLLSFPVTHFRADLSFDEPRYRDHCDWLLQHAVAGLFAAGGTGEFFALTPSEVAMVCRAAVEQTRGRVPVIDIQLSAGLGCAFLPRRARAITTLSSGSSTSSCSPISPSATAIGATRFRSSRPA